MTDARLDAANAAVLFSGTPSARLDVALAAVLVGGTPSARLDGTYLSILMDAAPGASRGPLGYSSVQWLRAKDAAGAVSQWNDQSGLFNHFTASSGTPNVSAGATPAGGQAVRFAADSQMTLAAPNLPLRPIFSSQFASEPATQAFDGSATTYFTTNGTVAGYLGFQLMTGPRALTSYKITRRDDLPNRNLAAWTFEGSTTGEVWTVLDTRSGITWPTPGEVKTFTFTNTTPYAFYRVNFTANNGDVTYSSIAELDPGQAAELWVVIKSAAAGINGAWQYGSSSQGSEFPFSDGKVYEAFAEGGSARESWTPSMTLLNNWRLYRVANDGTSWQAWLDNHSELTASNRAIAWAQTNWTLGIAPGTSGAGRLNAYVAEILVRDVVSSPTEVAALITYFNTEHGLTVPGGSSGGGGGSVTVTDGFTLLGHRYAAGAAMPTGLSASVQRSLQRRGRLTSGGTQTVRKKAVIDGTSYAAGAAAPAVTGSKARRLQRGKIIIGDDDK